MRLSALALIAAVSGGCSTTPPDPCAGQTNACIAARVEGAGLTLDQLSVTIDAPVNKTVLTPSAPVSKPFGLPILVGLLLPGAQDMPVNVTIVGLRNGNPVAADTKQVAFQKNRATQTFTLTAGVLPPDMTVVEIPDMAQPLDQTAPPFVISGNATIMGRELEPLTATGGVTDPLRQPFTLSATALPDGAIGGADGGALTMTWTPDFTQAGTYMPQVQITAQNTARNTSFPITFKIANSADPVPGLNPNDTAPSSLPPTNSIGDFDGDGKADLASCAVSAAGTYTIYILYGAPEGFPVVMNPPTRTYSFNGNFGSVDNTRLRCIGADMDGDGLSDVIIPDKSANGGQGMIYVFFGVARAQTTSAFVQAIPNGTTVAGEALGANQIFLGHYTTNGFNDFAIETYPTGASVDNIYIVQGLKTRPAGVAFPAPTVKSLASAPCGTRQIVGFANLDNDAMGLDSLLVWDKNLGGTAGCPNTVVGGFQSFKADNSTKTWLRPSSTSPGYGVVSTLCDVNGDGFADLVVPDGVAGGNALIYFGPFPATGGPPPALDISMALAIPASPAGHLYNDARCVKNFFNMPASLLLIDPGDATNSARVDIVNPGRMGGIARQLPVPLPDKKYGLSYGGTGDFNGDGKNDAVVGSPGGRFWTIYGR